MHVTNADLLSNIRLVEGEHYKETVLVDTEGRPPHAAWTEWRAKQTKRYADDPEYLAMKLSKRGSTGIIIYGWQGWNRYYVLGDGSVVFSRHHGRKTSLETAVALGFEIFE